MHPKAKRLAQRAAKAAATREASHGAEAGSAVQAAQLPAKKVKKKQKKEAKSDMTQSITEAVPAESLTNKEKKKQQTQAVTEASTRDAAGVQSVEGLPPKWRRKNTVDDWRKKELEKRNSTKYHYLKFIEKQKVERKLKSCRRSLLAATEAGKHEEVAALKKQLKAHLADYEYIEHYPKHLPYNSLFPKEDSELSRRRRDEIRKIIKESVDKEQQQENSFHSSGNDIASDDVVPARTKHREPAEIVGEKSTTGKKKKRKHVDASAAEDAAPAAGRKKKTIPQESLNQSGAKQPKARKVGGEESKAPTPTDDMAHPSWQASKSAKNSGVLVKSAGTRQVFGSDDENE